MDLQCTVVLDKAQLPKLVHEMTHTRSRRADHLREGLLADLRENGLRSAFLAKIGQQEQSARQPLLARVEQLVDQAPFNEYGSSQEMPDEHFGKPRLLVERPEQGSLLDPNDLAFCHCPSRRHAQRLTRQRTFTKEFIRPKDCNYGFLAMLGNDAEFDVTCNDIEDIIRLVALREDDLIFSILGGRPGEKDFGIEG